jgi:hypothetical protein
MTTIRRNACLLGSAIVAVSLVAACSKDLKITNPNSITTTSAQTDPNALQLLATGVMNLVRGTRSGVISAHGRFGREYLIYQPSEPRPTKDYLIGQCPGCNKIDPASGAAGDWSFGALRNIYIFKNGIPGNTVLTDAQKNASLGFAKTFEAEQLMEQIAGHDTIGGVVQILDDPTQLAPFVTRDSMYRYILGTLTEAATLLSNGGTAFPFTFPSGFTGFNTPTTFTQLTQALRAKASAWYATSGGGAAAWTAAADALGKSFLNRNAATLAALNVGVYWTFGPTPDSPNGFATSTNPNGYAHPSFSTDAQLKANGAKDDRFTRGIIPEANPFVPTNGIVSPWRVNLWPAQTSTISVIRNEELIALDAEVRLATGDKAGAIQDINTLRTVSGGLAATTLTAASADDVVLTEILYNKRYSTMMEGNRWTDMRRYHRLSQLPLDIPSGPNMHFVAVVEPIPLAECDQRRAHPGPNVLGPGTQNNCVP